MSGFKAIGSFLRERIGWHGVGLAASLVIIAIAAVVLYEMLRNINPGEVLDALTGTEPWRVGLAALFVAGAYFTLTFYDWFALRTIGMGHVPYRTAALASFTSYAIGHNVGFSAFTGGTVRYRIYSAHGLGAIDVAKLCFVTGLTFWLGNIAILGIGISIEPWAASAVDQLPPWVNRLIGLALLAGLAFYVAWVGLKPRRVGIGKGHWAVTLPGSRLTLLQIGIGIIDLSFCAAAMYVLMPQAPFIDPIALGVVFISATLLGFASHAPGGLGVFDAAMLVALPQFEKEPLLGALLLLRLLYYVTPFTLALLALGTRELLLSRSRRAQPSTPAVEPTALPDDVLPVLLEDPPETSADAPERKRIAS
ncbi:lysylphosphatidylglycerol synthase domain-containing protein [Bosea sp. 117]|uniref:lysylphosphatidylglycerol synthase domain-containing protein n=1 Tax=Bosea sp. 117 TaxID=1125973 RepID=UPI000493E4A2|nr:lysylphosphatidylglycerol synthase domain-containing protein [Bosea sp. 117]